MVEKVEESEENAEVILKPDDLDEMDYAILYELDVDGRIPYSTIAEKYSLYTNTVRRKVERMIKLGVIKGFSVTVDTYPLDYTTHNIFIKLTGITPEELALFYQSLINTPEVSFILKLIGRYNALISVKTKSLVEFDTFIQNLNDSYGDYISLLDDCPRMNTYYYAKKYLLKKKPTDVQVAISEGNIATSNISRIDRAILQKLKDNSRAPWTQIAKELKLHKETVALHVERLIEQKIIKKFNLMMRIQPLGYTWYLCLFKLRKKNHESMEKLKHFVREHPNIVFMNEGHGRWDVLLDIHCKGALEFDKIITEIRHELIEILAEDQVETVVDRVKHEFALPSMIRD